MGKKTKDAAKMSMDEMLDQYFKLQGLIYAECGYTEGCLEFALADETDKFWRVGDYEVLYAETAADLVDDESEMRWVEDAYLDAGGWIFRGKKHTMVRIKSCMEGNQYLLVLDNEKEV